MLNFQMGGQAPVEAPAPQAPQNRNPNRFKRQAGDPMGTDFTAANYAAINSLQPPSDLDTLRMKLGLTNESDPNLNLDMRHALAMTMNMEHTASRTLQANRMAGGVGQPQPQPQTSIYQAMPNMAQMMAQQPAGPQADMGTAGAPTQSESSNQDLGPNVDNSILQGGPQSRDGGFVGM